jgi:hypothetical protein
VAGHEPHNLDGTGEADPEFMAQMMGYDQHDDAGRAAN